MKLSRLALAVALLNGLPLSALAQGSQATILPDQVITSGRIAEPADQVTAATSVFTRADIERLQARSVAEVLQYVPGVNVTHNGSAGSVSGTFMRGMSLSQTLVLVDGQRIASASNGGASLEFINIDQIERIEVVRGARSALYGSDAIGGIIQIFTRTGDGQGLKPYLRLAAGSNKTFERSLGVSGGDQQTRYHLGAALEESQGIDSTRDNIGYNGDRDGLRKRSLSLNLSHRFNEDLEVGLSGLDQRGEAEWDENFAGSQQPYDQFQLSSTSAYLDWRILDAWRSRLELGHSADKRLTRDDRADDSKLYSYNTYRDAANWLNTLQLDDSNQLLVGLDWYRDRLTGSTRFDEDSRWNQSAYIQHRYQGEHLRTELGLRHDKNQQFGSENTWNGAITVPLDARNELTLSYSEGFRAPTFNDLYYPDYCDPLWGCFSSANPDLKPERSKSYELQWRNRFSDSGHLDVSLYRTDLKDAIVFSDIPRNVQTARVNGLEIAVAEDLAGWQTSLALGLTDARDRDSGHTLPRRAKQTLTLGTDRHFGAFNVGATWRAVGQRFDTAENDVELAGYGLLGLRGGWKASEELALDLKLENLFDHDYSEASYSGGNGRFNYRTPGRTALLGLTWTPQF